MAHLKLSRIAVAALAVCGCGSAMAVPAALIAAALPAAFAAAAPWIALGTSLLGSAVLSRYSSSQARKKQAAAAAAQRAQYNAGLQDRNITGLAGESPWQIVYGLQGSVGGSINAILSSGDKDQFKHLLVEFAAHEGTAIDEVYIDGEPVGPLNVEGWAAIGAFVEVRTDRSATETLTFDTLGQATAGRVVDAVMTAQAANFTQDAEGRMSLQSYIVTAAGAALQMSPPPTEPVVVNVSYVFTERTSRVNVQKHLSPGGADVADAFIINRAPSAWGPADRLSGHTYVWITLDQNMARFQGGPPNITARLRGKPVYDWRTGATAYSSNPALCLADFIMSRAGFGATLAQIDAPAVIAAANACDAAGFNCDGAFKTAQDRETTKQQLEDAFGGSCHESGGVWRIIAGAWSAPVMHLTDADLAAPIQVVQAGYTAKERFNTVRGTYIDVASLGVATDYAPWANPVHLAADGIERVKDLSLPFTKDHQRTQDLARMLVERSRGGLTITYPAFLRAWPLQPGDRVAVTNAEFGWAAKTFRVTDWAFSPRTPVALRLVEDVAAFYDPAAVITVDAAPNTNLPNPFVGQNLAGLTAQSGTQYLQQQTDGTVLSRVFLSWSASASNYVITGGRVEVQWRLASSTDDAWQSVALPGGAASTFLSDVQDGTLILIRARFVTSLNVPGNWQTLAHQVVGKTEPPSAVTGVALTQELVFFTGVNDVDLAGYEIRVVPGITAQWSLGVPVHDGLVTDSPYQLLRRLTGVQTVMVAAIDDGGRVGTPGAASLDFGVIDPYNVADRRDFAALGWPGDLVNASVVGGAIVADADPAIDFWAIGGDDFWTHDNAVDLWGGSSYLPMQWVTTYTPAYGGGDVILDTSTAGSRVVIEWRIDGSLLGDFWSPAGAGDFWSGSGEFWGAENAWQPYIGSIGSQAGQGMQFRVSIDGGPQQGQITAAGVRLQMPDKEQVFNNIAISALGTRLDPAAGVPPLTWITVEEANPTIYADGSGAAYLRVTNFDPVLGPQVETLNALGVPVDSTAQTVRVRGF